MRARLFQLVVLLICMMILASPTISKAQVTHALSPVVEMKTMGVTAHLNTFSTSNQVPSQNVELLGHFGGITEAIFVKDTIAYIGEGPQLTLVDVSNPSSPTLLGKTEPLKGIVRDILVLNDIAYVITARAGNTWNAEDNIERSELYFIDVLNSHNPQILSFVEIGTAYLESVFVEGNLAYVSGSGNIKIINVSNPVLPVEVGTLPYGGSIVVKDKIAYIASSNYFFIVDISTLDQVVRLAELANVQLSSMSLVGNHIIATSYEGINQGFVIIDVSNPEQPSILTSLTWRSAAVPPQLSINGEILYLIEQNAGGTPAKLRVFDISNPNQVTEINTIGDLPEEISTGVGRIDIRVSNNIAYISSSSGGLAIINVADPTHPIVQGFYDVMVSNFQSYFVEGNVLYIVEVGRGLRTLDISNPAHLTKLGFYDSPGEALKVFVDNGIAYLADGSHELRIINATDPTKLIEVGSYDQQIYLSDVFVDRGIAYTLGSSRAGSSCTLVTYDVSSIDQPKFLSETGPCINSIFSVENNMAYLSTLYGLELFDVSNPITPTQINSYYAGSYPLGYVKNGIAYIIHTSGELQIVDVSSRNELRKLGSLPVTRPTGVAVEANIAYISVGGRGLSLIDVSSPSNMAEIGFYKPTVEYPKIFVKNDIAYLGDRVGGMYILRYTPPNTMTYNISGHVTDNFGRSIAGVTISDGIGHTTLTDMDGNYGFLGLSSGTYTLIASKAGDNLFWPAQKSAKAGDTQVNFLYLGGEQDDADGDALPNIWEISGRTVITNGQLYFLDLPNIGASPVHKDVFVEVDYMVKEPDQCIPLLGYCWGGENFKPQQQAIDTVVASFAQAPVNNPDGETGINLHVDLGVNSSLIDAPALLGRTNWGELSHSNLLPYREYFIGPTVDFTNESLEEAVNALKNSKVLNSTIQNFTPERDGVFHYSLFINTLGGKLTNGCGQQIIGNPSGVSLALSASFLIARSATTEVGAKSGTFMHELGHSLGLQHGGADEVQHKPNYLSVMNYSFQFYGLSVNNGTFVQKKYDYSRFDNVPQIVETGLNEKAPFSSDNVLSQYASVYYCMKNGEPTSQTILSLGRMIDWNCSGTLEESTSADVNYTDDAKAWCIPPTLETLVSQNDWKSLNYAYVSRQQFSQHRMAMFSSPVIEIDQSFLKEVPTLYNLSLKGNETLFVTPGTVLTLPFTLTNTGLQIITVNLVLTQTSTHYDTSQVPSSVTLAPSEQRLFHVNLSVPANADISSQSKIQVKATAPSIRDLFDLATVETTVVTQQKIEEIAKYQTQQHSVFLPMIRR